MKVVLDTNIWLSGLFWEGESYKLIRMLEQKKAEIIISKKILIEISDVLNEEAKFQKFIEDRKTAIEDIIRTILHISRIVLPKSRLNIIKEHPPDNNILQCAFDGKAEYLISYDNHLLKLKRYKKIKIISPAEFIKKFN